MLPVSHRNERGVTKASNLWADRICRENPKAATEHGPRRRPAVKLGWRPPVFVFACGAAALIAFDRGWVEYFEGGRRGKELNLLPLPCAGSALPMSYAPSATDDHPYQ